MAELIDNYDYSTSSYDDPLANSLAVQSQLEPNNKVGPEQEADPLKVALDITELYNQMRNKGIDNGKAIEMSCYQEYPSKRNFYKPSLISIGPKFSKEVDQVKNKEYKKRYSKSRRAVGHSKTSEQHNEEDHEEYKKMMENKEMALMANAKKYYDEIGITYPQNDEELVEMLVLDGCFVVEFVLKCKEGGNGDPRNSVEGKKAREDMLLFENQLPFEVVSAIYKKMIGDTENVPSFIRLVKFAFASLAPNFTFYNFYDDNPPKQPKDLIHVVYSLCLPIPPRNPQNVSHCSILLGHFCPNKDEAKGDELESNKWLSLKHINSATELQEFGVNFKNTGQVYTMPKEYTKLPSPSKETKALISLFDVTFSKGEMSIPCIKVDNSTELFFRNMIALEQQRCELNPKYYTDYARLMSQLVKANKDITFLRKNGTIHSLLGEDGKVAYMFNNMSVEIDASTNFYFESLYTAVDGHCRNRRHVWKQKVKKFFYVLWKVISITLSAISLLLLAIHEYNA